MKFSEIKWSVQLQIAFEDKSIRVVVGLDQVKKRRVIIFLIVFNLVQRTWGIHG